jgi:ABC-type phosphate/phosphonate transport system substrate-binding protein
MSLNSFEMRVEITKHMAKMLLEMAEVDFDALPAEEEQTMLEDFEEVAGHLLDSLGFDIKEVVSDKEIVATIAIQDVETYIKTFLENNS